MSAVEVGLDDYRETLRARSSRPTRSIPFFSKYGICNRKMRDLLMTQEHQERIHKAHKEAISYACTVDDQDPLWMGVLNYCDPRSKGIDDAVVVDDDDDIRLCLGKTKDDEQHMGETKCEVDVTSQEWGQEYTPNGVCNRRMHDLLRETEEQQRLRKAEEDAMRFACTVDEEDPLWGGMLTYCDPRSKSIADAVKDESIPMSNTMNDEPMDETKSEVDISPQGYSANGVGNRRMQGLLMEREGQERLRKAEEEALRFACTMDEQDPLWRTILDLCDPRSSIRSDTVDPNEGEDPSHVARADPVSDSMRQIYSLFGVGRMSKDDYYRTVIAPRRAKRLAESEGVSRELAALEIDCDDDDPAKSPTTRASEGSSTSWLKLRDFSSYRYDEDNTSIVTNQSSKKPGVGIGAKASSSIEVIYDNDRTEGRRCTIWGKGPTPSPPTDEITPDAPDEGHRCTIMGKTGAVTSTITSRTNEVDEVNADEGRRCTVKRKAPLIACANEVAGDASNEDRRCSVNVLASPTLTHPKAVDVEDADEANTKEVAADDINEGRRCLIKAKTPTETSAKEVVCSNERSTDSNEGPTIMTNAPPIANTKEVAADDTDEGRRCTIKAKAPPTTSGSKEIAGDAFDEGRRCTPWGDKARPIATFDESLRRCETFRKASERRVEIRQTQYVSPPRSRN